MVLTKTGVSLAQGLHPAIPLSAQMSLVQGGCFLPIHMLPVSLFMTLITSFLCFNVFALIYPLKASLSTLASGPDRTRTPQEQRPGPRRPCLKLPTAQEALCGPRWMQRGMHLPPAPHLPGNPPGYRERTSLRAASQGHSTASRPEA